MTNCPEILNNFPELLTHISGPLETTPLAPTSSAENPKKDSVLFIPNSEIFNKCLNSEALLLIIDHKLAEQAKTLDTKNKTIFTTKNLQAAMALINQKYFISTYYKRPFNNSVGVHPKAFVADSVKLGENITICPGATVNDDCVIGNNVYIGANAVIEAGTTIGNNCHIFPLVFIGHGTTIGNNCKIQSGSGIASDGFGYGQNEKGEHIYKPHLGNVVLEDNVDIGAGVYIDRGTYENSKIGEGTKIDNICHFGHNINMGKHNIVTGGFMAAGSVTIGDHCIFGGRTTVTGHIKIASQLMFAGLSGVSKSMLTPGKYGGYPVQSLKDSLKTLASLQHLPALRKAVKKLSKNS